MESTTPTSAPPGRQVRNRERSTSRHGRITPTRPTTPLRDRAPSRTSLRASTTTPIHSSSYQSNGHPLDILEPAFAEFSDSMADLEANMMHLQLLQESLNRFNENFGAFLYGLNMNAFTVDFTEAPGVESFKRAKDMTERQKMQDTEGRGTFGFGGAATAINTKTGLGGGLGRGDVDATFLTTDTSFVENPPTPRTTTSNRTKMTPAPPSASSARPPSSTRGGRGASTAASRTRGPPVVRGTRATQMAAQRRETMAARGRGNESLLR